MKTLTTAVVAITPPDFKHANWPVLIGALVVLLIVVVSIIVVAARKPRGPMYCPSCGTTARPRSRYQGSDALSIVLLLLFFPVGVIYELWRGSAPQWVCPACEHGGMLPLTTPAARAAQRGSVGAAEALGRVRD